MTSLIYFLLRQVARLGLSVFYRRRVVLGKEHFDFEGPAIVIANHPSTLIDVLNPGLEVRQEMHFLANYGLFRHPVSNWFFSKLYCIPVMRPEDVREGERRDNSQAFELSFQHMEHKGILFIAPEGVSWMNRFVRSLKTGAARIALGAEARNNWQLDVKVIPVGLSYSAPNLFRSNVVVQAGEPVYAREWAEQYQNNPGEAVQAMTDRLKERLESLSIHTRDEAGEIFITRLETIVNHSWPTSLTKSFYRTQALVRSHLDDEALREKTEAYWSALEQAKVADDAVAEKMAPRTWRKWLDLLVLVLGLPVFLVGYAFWFLPCYLPWLLNKKLDAYIGYGAVVKTMAGLITFPLALIAAWWLATLAGASAALAWMLLPLLIAAGLLTEVCLDILQRLRNRLQLNRLPTAQISELARLRENAIASIRIS